jgi:hypothetical protein
MDRSSPGGSNKLNREEKRRNRLKDHGGEKKRSTIPRRGHMKAHTVSARKR